MKQTFLKIRVANLARKAHNQMNLANFRKSEFWVTAAAMTLTAILVGLDVDPATADKLIAGIISISGLAATYTGGRSIAKASAKDPR